METTSLKEFINEKFSPHVVGRLACVIGSDTSVVQRHRDGRKFTTGWVQHAGFLRGTFCVQGTDLALTQIDIHGESGTIRVEAWEPCSITVEQGTGLLFMNRYRDGE
jgi:hypothetical protein